ncbi:MAG: NADH-quinone oxidoreductase subunit J, partial [bacterium]
LFVFCTIVALGSAVAMILQRYMVYSVGLMIIVLLGIAGLFLTLNAPFLALVQVIVYAGAVMVLFVFTAMIVGEKKSSELNIGSPYSWLSLGIVSLLMIDLGLIIREVPFAPGKPVNTKEVATGGGPIYYLGELLFTDYLLALQVVGFIILTALVGAIYRSEEGTT